MTKALQTATTFRMECRISTPIAATPEKLWKLLTTSADFPRWNTTVSHIEGDIALGRQLEVKVPISPRTFTPKVIELEAPKRMVWGDGFAPMFRGVRTFTLEPKADGTTEFTMAETFSGLMLPMIKSSLPDFGPAFEQYAADLKREAEQGS